MSNAPSTLIQSFFVILSYVLVAILLAKDETLVGRCHDDHGDLLIGHQILHHTLGKESQLKFLGWVRQATFRGPSGDLERLLTRIHQTSARRGQELERLWKLDPPINLAEAPISKIGDAIQDSAENRGTVEMIKPHGDTWNVRFYFLQAQATRMVAAIAFSAASMDPNVERRNFLQQLSKEYEDLRNELVEAVSVCKEL
jgi:hypothetical protein